MCSLAREATARDPPLALCAAALEATSQVSPLFFTSFSTVCLHVSFRRLCSSYSGVSTVESAVLRGELGGIRQTYPSHRQSLHCLFNTAHPIPVPRSSVEIVLGQKTLRVCLTHLFRKILFRSMVMVVFQHSTPYRRIPLRCTIIQTLP